MTYCVPLLLAMELTRRFAKDSDARLVFEASLPDFVVVAAMIGLAIGGAGLFTGQWRFVTPVFALASIVFLWLRRFRREKGLEHIGLVLAWLATGTGACWAIGLRSPAILLGWLAVVSAIDGAVLVAVQAFGRGKWTRSILDPLREMGSVTAVASFVFAVAASTLNLDSYALALAALLLLVAMLIASAKITRSPLDVYGAVDAAVSASYLTLFELGRYRTGSISTLGVLASILSIAFWTIDRCLVRWAKEDWKSLLCQPLRYSAAVLAVAALVPDVGTPWALLIAGLPFVLLVKSLSSAAWLYPAIGSLLASAYFAVNARWGYPRLAPTAIVMAFACWPLGLMLGRSKTTIRYLLGLSDNLEIEQPAYHVTISLGLLALGLRCDAVLRLHESWSASPWQFAALGVLSLLMLEPYAHRGWVDGFMALVSLAIISTFAGRLGSPMSWALLGMILALVWRTTERGVMRVQSDWARRLGVGFDRIDLVANQWSTGFLAMAALTMGARLVTSVLVTTFDIPDVLGAPLPLEWAEGFVAILLFGANIEWVLHSANESKHCRCTSRSRCCSGGWRRRSRRWHID